jgi:DNA modification methylase
MKSMKINEVYEGNCLDVMREFPDNCIDSIITDPPYGLQFMGKDWDYGLPGEVYWYEALRIAKPGATLLAFGGSRTHHRLACAIEDAGWEIRDCIMWVYGSGFPKSTDISKQLDKAAIVDCQYCNGSGKGRPSYMIFCPEHGEIRGDNDLCPVCDSEVEEIKIEREPCRYCGGSGKVKGAEREITGRSIRIGDKKSYPRNANSNGHTLVIADNDGSNVLTAPVTPLAAKFDGYGTALKPAYEPIVVAMKPIDGTFAANAEKWGVSGLWIDGGRVGENPGYKYNAQKNGTIFHGEQGERIRRTAQKNGGSFIESSKGRFPANVIHDGSEEVMAEFDKAGVSLSVPSVIKASQANRQVYDGGDLHNKIDRTYSHNDSGTPARYFAQCPPDPTAHPDAARFHYCPKAGKRERGNGNNHPTVKPLSLLRYLAKLTRPPDGGIVLDPFAGSGTTALACIAEDRDYIIIEKEPEYAELCRRRIAEYSGVEIAPIEVKVSKTETVKQASLW